jgi:hypothetical protein
VFAREALEPYPFEHGNFMTRDEALRAGQEKYPNYTIVTALVRPVALPAVVESAVWGSTSALPSMLGNVLKRQGGDLVQVVHLGYMPGAWAKFTKAHRKLVTAFISRHVKGCYTLSCMEFHHPMLNESLKSYSEAARDSAINRINEN